MHRRLFCRLLQLRTCKDNHVLQLWWLSEGRWCYCGERQGDDDDSAFDWVKRPCALEGGGVTRYNGTTFYCKEVKGEG